MTKIVCPEALDSPFIEGETVVAKPPILYENGMSVAEYACHLCSRRTLVQLNTEASSGIDIMLDNELRRINFCDKAIEIAPPNVRVVPVSLGDMSMVQ